MAGLLKFSFSLVSIYKEMLTKAATYKIYL